MMKRSHESIIVDDTAEQSIVDNADENNLNQTEIDKKKRNKKRKFKPKGNNKESKKENKFNDTVYENDLYFAYYKEQLKEVVKEEDEWIKIKEAWLRPLPVTFRINLSSNKIMKNLHVRIEELSQNLKEVKFKNQNGNDIDFQSIPWYPDQNAWFIPVSSRALKKKETPIFEEIHHFLVENNSKGYITRQEAVSMIPCLLLDVKSHHAILDMCAAPGSKTSQILEMMHLQAQQNNDNFYNNLSGTILANDIKPQRCNTLITQTKRLNSPCIIVTYHEAQIFPSLFHPIKKRPILFDRILCDVPCSGDGTLRKHPDIWNKWKPSMGAGIHTLQLQILSRAIKLLKPNGRIVYSTCSLNPVENEAVVARALSENPDLHLVDVSRELSGLHRSNGIDTWKFMDNEGNWYCNYDELPEKLKRLPKTMFPPENASSMNLERCIRILPHHQDSGGFFVAVLERKPEGQQDLVEDDNIVYEKKVREKPVPGGAFTVPTSDEFKQAWSSIEQFFDFDSFPKDQILTRSDNASKLYFVSKSSKYIFDYDIVNKLKIKHMGVRVFEKTCTPDKVKCNYRICQEGVEVIAAYCRSRLLEVSKKDMLALLQEKEVLFTNLESESILNGIDEGPCIFRTTLENSAVLVSGWRGKAKVRIFLKELETSYYINQLN